ncbi:MAG: endonuclease MutS2 [Deltaproteobacteria bacterium]|nr:endonuclease MutS2 [Deltaproteobacteria bacterium]
MIPQNSLDLLEFNKLLEIIAQRAKSDASRSVVLSIRPLSDRNEIEKRFALIQEIRRMAQEGRPLSILPFADIGPLLQKVRPDDAILEPLELVGIMDFLHAIHETSVQIRKDISLISLNEIMGSIAIRTELLHSLNSSIDREGNILDSASPRLAELRAEKRRLENRVRKRLEDIIRGEKIAPFLQDDFITQRSGRWVIPVRMDSKGQVQGVVHDVSRTGETAFVEPLAVIGLSNELENIIADEKAEGIRVLRQLGALIRETADGLEHEFRILVFLDMLNCIASLAQEFDMKTPVVHEENALFLAQARHPLLLHAARHKNAIIPLDARLGGDKTVMIITGPNAGGKTVAIKTVGLLMLMALSGMPVPAGDATVIPLFHNLLVDIGDRQSLADNLSTFTAHLANMMEFLRKADSKTLVLIDEMGTGTDPEEGAALAGAILKELCDKGSLVFATTHLADIKIFAHKQERMLNAAMEIDRTTLAPLYQLRIGEPGQSFALETAQRYGLPDEIIQSAKAILGRTKVDMETLIRDLEIKRRHYEEALEKVEMQSHELKRREMQTAELLRDAEAQKKAILAEAYKQASEAVSDIKTKMQILFQEMKKREKIVGTRHVAPLLKEAASLQDEVSDKIKAYENIEPLSPDELKQGDVVFVKTLGYDAAVVKILKKKDRLKVKAGNLEMEVAIADVGRRTGKSAEVITAASKTTVSDESAERRLNLIGLRVDEALPRLEEFLNHAALAGLSEVTIIHGIGAGILAKAVREHVSGHPLVKSFRGGEQSEGGGGVTVVSLK